MPQSSATDSWESSEDDDQVTRNPFIRQRRILLTPPAPQPIRLKLAHELDGNILEVTPTSFFDAFFRSTSGTLEEKCLEALRNPESGFFQEIVESQLRAEWLAVGSEHPDGKNYEAIRTAVLQRLSTYDQEKTQFQHFVEVKYGDDIYQSLASLLNFISHFYRFHLKTEGGVDKFGQEWPEATQTWPRVGVESDGTSPAESGPSSQPLPSTTLPSTTPETAGVY
ncbi:hypothetical protein M407DRAFT_25717 [Tulasnella calospora MUT 4182]|uniref:Uncharacterized protein n=1 Tax=Tulasnella calospora MUT 4182 TaxID=1051891 RepID=A0A0C3Q6H2_9AGAM|nr:hypothetical protein M407DRAFT_25717 [Tulasnella calospora MUT 4182]